MFYIFMNLVSKITQSRLQKYCLVIASVFATFGLLYPQSIYGSAPDFQDLLKKLDADLDHLVNMCSKDIDYYTKQSCLDQLEESWWIECREYYDKLDTCKNGKVENFLKNNGRPT